MAVSEYGGTRAGNSVPLPEKERQMLENTGGVVHLTHTRGHCITFWPSVPPLQVAPSFACSVASLSRFPGHQLPGFHSLRHVILADYLLGQGGPSTCVTGHDVLQYTSSPYPHWGTGDWILPVVEITFGLA